MHTSARGFTARTHAEGRAVHRRELCGPLKLIETDQRALSLVTISVLNYQHYDLMATAGCVLNKPVICG